MANEAEVDLLINATQALPDLERNLGRIIRTAENNAEDLDVNAVLQTQTSISRISTQLNTLVNRAEAGADDIDVTAVLNQLQSLNRVRRTLDDVVTQVQSGSPEIDVNAVLARANSLRSMRRDLTRMTNTLNRTVDPVVVPVTIDEDEDTERTTGRLTGLLGNLARTAGRTIGPIAGVAGALVGLGAAGAGLIPVMAGIVGAIQNIAPVAAVAVSAMLAIKLAAGTVKLAMVGVEDAITAAFDPKVSPDEFAEKIKGLAPSAREFVTELRSMRGALREIQQSVQQRVFTGFADSLERLAQAVLPDVEKALNSTADSLNLAARGGAEAAAELGERGVLGQALDSATRAMRTLVNVPGQVVASLGVLAAAAGPTLERLAQRVANVSERISTNLITSFETGRLEQEIDQAVAALRQLGRIGGNVLGSIKNLFDSAEGSGHGLFDTLENLTQALEDTTASEGFQRTLGGLIDVFAELAKEVGPLLITTFEILGRVVDNLVEPAKELINIFGDELNKTLKESSPVWESLSRVIAAAAPIVGTIIGLAGELARDVLPILNPLLQGAERIFAALAPVVDQLAKNIGGQLRPVFQGIADVLDMVVPKLAEIVERLAPFLQKALEELQPHLEDMGNALGELLRALGPLIVKFLEFQLFLIEKLGPILGPIAFGLILVLGKALTTLASFITTYVVPAIETIVAILSGDFTGAMRGATKMVNTFTSDASSAFVRFRNAAARAVGSFVSTIISQTALAASRFVSSVSSMTSRVVQYVQGIPGRIRRALGTLGLLLYSAGQDVVRGLLNGITSQVGALYARVSSMAQGIRNKVASVLKIFSPSRVFADLGKNTVEGFIVGIKATVPDLTDTVTAMARAVPRAAQLADISTRSGTAPFSLPLAPTPAPSVTVYIGSDRLDERIDYRVRKDGQRRTRDRAQGWRY